MPDVCESRKITAPDAREIPIPVGELVLGGGETIDVPADAEVQVSVSGTGQYYVAMNFAGPANNEVHELLDELFTEAKLKALETALVAAGGGVAVEILGGVIGALISIFTPSHLTREVYIRGNLSEDDAQVTYCLLLDATQ